ncbi:MAG: glycosyltransferase family 9 protein [Verrucomicrobiota bacterium]
MANNKPRILVVRGGAIGDFILTLPAIQLLRENLPLTPHIEILGYPAITKLAEDAGIADSTRSIEYAALANFFNPKTILDPDLMDYFAVFNVVVSYLYDPDGFFHINMKKSGVDTYLAASHRIDESSALPAAAQLAKPLEELALFLDNPAPALSWPNHLHDDAKNFLSQSPKPIALHPGSGSPTKNWPAQNWTQLIDTLHKEFPHHPLLIISGEADADSAGTVLAHCKSNNIPVTHADSLPLSTLGAILAQSTAFIGHDSGVSHLAAAAGTPSLLLFGPTNPTIWAPQNQHVTTLTAPESSLDNLPLNEVLKNLTPLLKNP